MHNNEQQVRALYNAWNVRDLTAWVDAFTPDARWTNVPSGETFTGPEGMEQNYTNWNVPFPDGQVIGITVLSGDDFAVAQFTSSGVNKGPMPTENGTIPATNKALAVPFCDVHRFIDGRISATHRYWDHASVLNALGL
ncbi:nuclear transport factor 2 family protein [Rhodococcus fascians]|nr:nuclear transport factor 2 family protein [Rhodococcus fascians]MBY4414757.1 nuclear transport factor 2 family protein [Rhodococcus fascians]